MTFARPTLDQLISRARADIEAEMSNGAAYLRRSFESAMAKVSAGLAHTQHGHLEFIARQVVPSTAEDEFLIAWAELFMGADARNAATAAAFDIAVTGTVNGTAIPLGTRWTRGDGQVFESVAAETLASLEATVSVAALVEGTAGNTYANTLLTMASPIVGIDASAYVEGTELTLVGGGSDIETIEQLRTRLIARLQDPPKGGALGDYVNWALTIDGVTRAWEAPNQLGPGTIVVLAVQDAFDADGFYVGTVFPNAATLALITEYIESVKPITAIVTVVAPIEVQAAFTIALEPNTAAVQLQVTRYLQDLFLREAVPSGTLTVSQLNEAISLAPGETDHTLVIPTGALTATAAQLHTLGAITFQTL